jgi:hypothetical protein
MYAKTNLGSGRMSPRQKRTFGVIGVLIVVLIGGLAIWGALRPDGYATSANGCVNLTLPGSMGGETFHYCGSAAQQFCEKSFQSTDQVSLQARPQCVLAGLAPPAGATPATSLQVHDDGDRAVVDQ